MSTRARPFRPIPVTFLKRLIYGSMRSLGYSIGRLHGIEQATWLSQLGIATVLDIGANVGQFSTSIRRVLPEARIYAFEPVEESFTRLSREMHADTLCRCFPYALGSEDGSAMLNKNAFTPSSSLLSMEDAHVAEFPYTGKTSRTRIEVRRLDSVVSTLEISEPLLAKMDVQGFELEVLEGGRETLARADVVITEVSFAGLYKGQPSFDDLYNELRGLGLDFCGVMEQTHSSRNDLPLFCDALFVRSGTL